MGNKVELHALISSEVRLFTLLLSCRMQRKTRHTNTVKEESDKCALAGSPSCYTYTHEITTIRESIPTRKEFLSDNYLLSITNVT
jgi:hypothetical protein